MLTIFWTLKVLVEAGTHFASTFTIKRHRVFAYHLEKMPTQGREMTRDDAFFFAVFAFKICLPQKLVLLVVNSLLGKILDTSLPSTVALPLERVFILRTCIG